MTVETTTAEKVQGAEVLRYLNRAIPVFIWISPVLAGLLSLHMGKSMAWDLLHYHYYNGYAFLNDRLNFDILPAVFHTFLNPALDVAFYAAVETLPPRAVGFGLGAIHGVNIILLFLCARRVLTRWGGRWADRSAGAQPAAGVSGGNRVRFRRRHGNLGSWHHDLIASLFFLGALLVLLRREGGMTLWRAAAAGLLVGIGLGLKLTLAPFVVAIVAAPLAGPGPVRERVAGLRRCRTGGGSGVAGFRRVLDGADVRGVRQSVLPVLQPAVRLALRRCRRWPRSPLSARKPVGISGLSRDLQLRRRPGVGSAVARFPPAGRLHRGGLSGRRRAGQPPCRTA